MTAAYIATSVAAWVLFTWLLTRRRRLVMTRPLRLADHWLILTVTIWAAALWPIGWLPVAWLSFGRVRRRIS